MRNWPVNILIAIPLLMRVARDTPIDKYDVAVALTVFFAIAIVCRLTGRGPPEIVIDETTGQQTERPVWRGLCRFAQIRRIFTILSGHAPKPVAALGAFSAPDPWKDNAKTDWTINFYFYQTSWRGPPPASAFVAGVKPRHNPMNEAIGIASADGRYHILPRVVAERWRQGALAHAALPALVRRLEPRLKRSDYMLHNRVTFSRAYAGFIGSIPLLFVAVVAILWITDSGPQGETELADVAIPGAVGAGMLGVAAALLCEPLWRRRRDRRIATLTDAEIPHGEGFESEETAPSTSNKTDLTAIIDEILRIGPPTPASLQRSLGAKLRKTGGNGPIDHYEAKLDHAPFRTGDLRIHRDTGHVSLLLPASEREPISEEDIGLARFGAPISINANPNIPPAGTTAYVYSVKDAKFVLDFHSGSRLLRCVSFDWRAVPRLLYFARPFEGSEGSVVYRVSRIGIGEIVSQVWRRGQWVDDPDIYRRYLNGFDADVAQVTEAEAARLTAAAADRSS